MIYLTRVGVLENMVPHDCSCIASVLPTTYPSSAGSVVGSAVPVTTCTTAVLPLLREKVPDLVMNTLLSVPPFYPTVLSNSYHAVQNAGTRGDNSDEVL